jgi:flavin reductase (DIM6/NTAB) family NADH-FMN oxidoreductase RutF
VGPLPDHPAILNNVSARCEELAVAAALEGDRRKVFHAICMDPLTSAVLSLAEMKEIWYVIRHRLHERFAGTGRMRIGRSGLDTPPSSRNTGRMQELGTFDAVDSTISGLGNGGLFLISGEQGNPMTIGWGVLGIIWGRPVFQVLVRPSRFSFSLLEAHGEFTVCLPRTEHKKALSLCGSVSGRDTDKIAECGFSLADSATVAVPHIAESVAHYECRVIHVNDVVNATLDPGLISRSYPSGDFHRIYFGEIQGVYRHE